MVTPDPAPRRLAHAELADLILEHAPGYAMATFDDDGRITGWSPGAEKVFGYTEDEAIGMAIDDTFLPSDRAAGAPADERRTARQESFAENSRWHLRKDGQRFWGNGITVRVQGSPVHGFMKILRDETRMKLADEQRILLLNELNHRVKNTLATVQSIAGQTLRAAGVPAPVRDDLSHRLQALSQAHDVLVTENWAGADLERIVQLALAPHVHDALPVFDVDGPPVRISPPQAVAIALALHELSTNALKHGALSTPQGRVSVTWNLAHDDLGARHLSLLWSESGGPPVAAPQRMGFGMRLIARTFSPESGGRSKVVYRPEGLCCIIEMQLSQREEIPILDIRAADPNKA